jgi:hypothetical protein
MQRWVERTEARWAFCAGIAGAVATAALGTKMILAHGSPAAGLGFVLLPALGARHPNATESVKRRAPR